MGIRYDLILTCAIIPLYVALIFAIWQYGRDVIAWVQVCVWLALLGASLASLCFAAARKRFIISCTLISAIAAIHASMWVPYWTTESRRLLEPVLSPLVYWIIFFVSREYFKLSRVLTSRKEEVDYTTIEPLILRKHQAIDLLELDKICLSICTLAGIGQIVVCKTTSISWCETEGVLLMLFPELLQQQLLVSTSHSSGFVWLLLIAGGILLPVIWISFSTICVQIVPYILHLHNIRQMDGHDESATINPVARMNIFFYLAITWVYLIAIPTFPVPEYYSPDRLLEFEAYYAGVAAGVSFCLAIFTILSPITTVLKTFLLAHHIPLKCHFCQNMVVLLCSFSVIHIVSYVPSYLRYPADYQFYAGIIIIIGFGGSTALAMKRKLHTILRSLQLIIACIGFMAFILHSESEWNFSIHSFEVVFLASIIALTLFFILFPMHELEVADYLGNQVVLLEVYYRESRYVPPGAFFNIYYTFAGRLSLLSSNTCTALSTQHSKLVFLIPTSESVDTQYLCFPEIVLSFPILNLSYLVHVLIFLTSNSTSTIYLQGPFYGPTSFISYLNSPVCCSIFLVGWNSGFASVFSLLEYLKEECKRQESELALRISSVNCLISEIGDITIRKELHKLVDNLVEDWQLDLPLTIIESREIDDLTVLTGISRKREEVRSGGGEVEGKNNQTPDTHDKVLVENNARSKWRDLFPHNKIWFVENSASHFSLHRLELSRVLYLSGGTLRRKFRGKVFAEI